MKNISLLIALCVSAISFAQMVNDKGSITGKILDLEADNSPLAFATVEVVDTNKTATTDFDGNFTVIGLEPGTYKLKVRFLGYQELYTKDLIVEADHTNNISYSLKAIHIEE